MFYGRSTPDQRRHRLLRMAADARSYRLAAPIERPASGLAAAASWDKPASPIPQPAPARPVHHITLYQQVSDWLQERNGSCYCDACIAQHYGATRKNVSIATRRLGTEDGFSKYSARCDGCGASRAVTLASRNRL